MTLDGVINLESIHHVRSGGGGYPYIWPIRLSVNPDGVSGSERVESRHILGTGLSVGESATIPSNIGQLRFGFDETIAKRAVILIVALWNAKETPGNVVVSACKRFYNSIPERFNNHFGGLITFDTQTEVERNNFINIIKNEVKTDVESTIRNTLSGYEKFKIGIGALTLDSLVDAAFILFDNSFLRRPEPPEASSESFPITLRLKDSYEIRGHLTIAYVPTDRCQIQVDAVRAAEARIRSLENQIRVLQQQRPINLSLINRIRMEELPRAIEALENAKRELQDCREFEPVVIGRGVNPQGRPL